MAHFANFSNSCLLKQHLSGRPRITSYDIKKIDLVLMFHFFFHACIGRLVNLSNLIKLFPLYLHQRRQLGNNLIGNETV